MLLVKNLALLLSRIRTCTYFRHFTLLTLNSPLGRGLLTGHIKNSQDLEEGDFRRSFARFQDEVCAHSYSNLAADVTTLPRTPGITFS